MLSHGLLGCSHVHMHRKFELFSLKYGSHYWFDENCMHAYSRASMESTFPSPYRSNPWMRVANLSWPLKFFRVSFKFFIPPILLIELSHRYVLYFLLFDLFIFAHHGAYFTVLFAVNINIYYNLWCENRRFFVKFLNFSEKNGKKTHIYWAQRN